jgi:hypothetical protein
VHFPSHPETCPGWQAGLYQEQLFALSFVLKNKNVFVQKTTLRRSIQMAPAFLVAGAPNPKGQLMASCLVNWLRQQADEEEVGI